jgi:hypothetical protein
MEIGTRGRLRTTGHTRTTYDTFEGASRMIFLQRRPNATLAADYRGSGDPAFFLQRPPGYEPPLVGSESSGLFLACPLSAVQRVVGPIHIRLRRE